MNITRIPEYIETGRKDLHWYEDCEAVFVRLFGASELPLVSKLFAATSINTSLKSNITLFRKAYYELQSGIPFSNYLPNIKKQLEQIRAGKELTGRKINSFAKAMSGDPDAVVVDIWLMRAFDMERKYQSKVTLPVEHTLFGRHKPELPGRLRNGGPTDKEYTAIEQWVRVVAKCMGVQPRQLSAMIWAGVRITHGGDTETHYKHRLEQSLRSMFNTNTLTTKTN